MYVDTMIPVVWTKVVVLVTLLLSTFLFSSIPLKFSALSHSQNLSTKRRYNRILSFLNCFAAGVFLGTCLLDLFPGVRDKIADGLNQLDIVSSFPLSEFIMAFGLFLIMIVEQIVLHAKDRHRENNSQQRRSLLSNNTNHYRTCAQKISDRATTNNTHSDVGFAPLPTNDTDSDDGHDHASEVQIDDNHTMRSIVLVMALSLHSVFEGLAVGLQKTTAAVLSIFAALALHKTVLAFSLGLNLVQTNLSVKNIIKSNLLFAVTSPIGIGAGIGLMDIASPVVHSLLNGILQGIASGTFLYVVFFEILPHEFNSKENQPDRLLKLLCLLVGFATVTGLIFLQPTVVKPSCYRGAQPAG